MPKKPGGELEVTIEGRKLRLTHVDKILFPATRFRKGELIDYYVKIAPFILPHLKDRPLTLKMYATGVKGPAQYIKNALSFTPKWIKKAPVPRRTGGPDICYLLINDLPSLVWVSNMNNIELHAFQARAPKIQKPTMMVFDLDPGEPAGLIESANVALLLRDALAGAGLQSLVKASGGKGLHVCVPLNTPVTYEQTAPFSHSVAQWLEHSHPDLAVAKMSKTLRRGKVFIDWSQNSDFKTTVCVYSLRAKGDAPTVSFPLEWSAVERAVQRKDPSGFYVDPQSAIDRLEKEGDTFAPLLELKQKLPRKFEPETTKSSPPKKLRAYHAKRDFGKTAEPSGSELQSKQMNGGLMFVIQKHAASHLHYDFRLEMEEVLRSWAVPKGPPTERGQSRLAMHVEDHPIDYARFEGTIPKGQYGGGTVMVWDIGTYAAKDDNPVAAYHRGKLSLVLHGKKLKGEWLLIRDRRDSAESGKQRWLLIKTGTDAKPISRKKDDESVLTGRSMDQIAHQNTAQWDSNQ
jgi:bifunctional non-homologous end joining protein LigD